RLLAPIYLTAPVHWFRLWDPPGPGWRIFTGWFYVFVVILSISLDISAAFVGISGSLDLLIRLCRSRSVRDLHILIPVKWCLILALTPIAVFFLIEFAFSLANSHLGETSARDAVFFIAIPASTLIFAGWVTRGAIRRWKKACESYFQFE